MDIFRLIVVAYLKKMNEEQSLKVKMI